MLRTFSFLPRSFSSHHLAMASIMVVDSPGFQNPRHQGKDRAATFEELCHNYVHERLQLLFYQRTFVSVLERYQEVRVTWNWTLTRALRQRQQILPQQHTTCPMWFIIEQSHFTCGFLGLCYSVSDDSLVSTHCLNPRPPASGTSPVLVLMLPPLCDDICLLVYHTQAQSHSRVLPRAEALWWCRQQPAACSPLWSTGWQSLAVKGTCPLGSSSTLLGALDRKRMHVRQEHIWVRVQMYPTLLSFTKLFKHLHMSKLDLCCFYQNT